MELPELCCVRYNVQIVVDIPPPDSLAMLALLKDGIVGRFFIPESHLLHLYFIYFHDSTVCYCENCGKLYFRDSIDLHNVLSMKYLKRSLTLIMQTAKSINYDLLAE